jgi:hypothetical protein
MEEMVSVMLCRGMVGKSNQLLRRLKFNGSSNHISTAGPWGSTHHFTKFSKLRKYWQFGPLLKEVMIRIRAKLLGKWVYGAFLPQP